MIRIGLVGAGLIAWAHALGLKATIDSGLVDAALGPVFDVDAERASRFAEVTGMKAVESLREVTRECDALWVCTPTASHREAVEEAAGAGCAVFCEKPLERDLARVNALVSAVADTGVPAQVGLVLRSTPAFRALREIVESGELGRPMVFSLRDDQYFPVKGIYGSTWRADVDVAGGGCLIEHSIHDLDIFRFCLGNAVEVSCTTANFAGHVGVEDLATVSLRFESGARAELVSVWHDITSRPSTRRIELFFERGLVFFDREFLGPLHVQTGEGTDVVECRSPEWVEELPLGGGEAGVGIRMYVEADRAFVDAVAKGLVPEPGFGDALVAHRLVDASYRSAAMGGVPVSIS